MRASEAGSNSKLSSGPRNQLTIEFEICCSSETGTDSIGYTEASVFGSLRTGGTFPGISPDHKFELPIQRLDRPLDF